MEKKTIKLLNRCSKKPRLIYLPKNFNDLIEKVKEFMPLNDTKKRYLLIEEISNREINNQDDFETMIKEHNDKSQLKISIIIIEKKNMKYFIILIFHI